MRRALLVSFLVSAWLSAQAPARAPSRPVALDGIDEAISQLAKITGLEPLKKVDHDTIDRAGLKKFLEERIKEEVKPEEIRLEELALKRFGLVPRDFNLEKATIDLLTEQAAAFYDFKRKKLYMLTEDAVKLPVSGEMAKEAQRMIVVHELAHALADQHFNLEKYIKRGRSDDSSLARMAVMEGQATWLMMEFMAQKMGQSLRESPLMVEMMGAASRQSMLSQYPVLSKSPLYVQQSLLFPYTAGLKFQQAVLAKSGNAGFGQVFRQPPATTQQVIHPDMYFAMVQPSTPKLPEPSASGDWNKLLDGSIGEFDHAVLLEQYLSRKDADGLAPAWRGGQMALLEHKRGKHVVLLYASEWADAAGAKRMFDAYVRVMKGKWTKLKAGPETETEFKGESEDGMFRLTLEGTRLTSIEGFRSEPEFKAPRTK
jgi:hypothetical protein